jgi:hypothetical protein
VVLEWAWEKKTL